MSTSGDVLLDKRFAYARAYLEGGDIGAAVDLLKQITQEAPRWAEGWLVLGRALEKHGAIDEARHAFGNAIQFDSQNSSEAQLHLAALSGETPPQLPSHYISALFDDYAPRFDAHLKEKLDYRAPTLLRAMLDKWCASQERKPWFESVIDLGCGTGLMGKELRNFSGKMTGVDLSPAMLAEARKTQCYDELIEGEIVSILQGAPPKCADLIVAADVAVYLGDLQPLTAAVAHALKPEGLFLFTVQALSENADYRFGRDLRYRHSEAYLRQIARQNGFTVAGFESSSLRKEAGMPMQGFVALWQRAGEAAL